MTIPELCTLLTNHPEIRSLTLSAEAYERLKTEAWRHIRYRDEPTEFRDGTQTPQILTCMDIPILREEEK